MSGTTCYVSPGANSGSTLEGSLESASPSQARGAPQVKGKEAIDKLYRQYGFGTGQLKEFQGIRTHLEVSSGGELAYEYGINRMLLAGAEGDLLDVGKYLCIWKKIHGEWFVTALSFTSDQPSPVGADN